eukprot:TRINITY_DN9456_c1_g1_i1.p2 TRINITY_DN9456_c1_g1~~TRINITY_DN9456_c1_g1_i1.p2  ORF type:complete len:147 (-),score=7.71 TRINITY_DN9456_c1_g1_i1:313-714(-)
MILVYFQYIVKDKTEDLRVSTQLRQFKSFTNTKYGGKLCNTYICNTPVAGVNTKFQQMKGGRLAAIKYYTLDKAFIAHYVIKYTEQAQNKDDIWSATMPGQKRGGPFFDMVDKAATENCLYMQEIAKKCCLPK